MKAMKTGTSSLNPYAASYIPLSRRGVTGKDSKSRLEGVWLGSQSEDMAKSMQQSASVGYTADTLHGNQGSPLKGYPVHGIYGSTSRIPNETTYKPTTDDEFDMDLAYLQTMFPGISEDSLSEVYFASRGDLEATVDMLNQLEVYSGDSSENLPDFLDIGDISETGTSSDGASQKLKKVADEVGGSSSGTTDTALAT